MSGLLEMVLDWIVIAIYAVLTVIFVVMVIRIARMYRRSVNRRLTRSKYGDLERLKMKRLYKV